MKAGLRVLITFAVLVGVVGGFYLITSKITNLTGYSVGEYQKEDIEKFATCLTEKGVKLYVYGNSGLCERQKEMFGEFIGKLNVINCLVNLDICAEKDLKFVDRPAWEIRGVIYYGPFDLSKLSKMSGCKI